MDNDELPYQERIIEGTDLTPEEVKLFVEMTKLPNFHLFIRRFIMFRERAAAHNLDVLNTTENERAYMAGAFNLSLFYQNLLSQFEGESLEQALIRLEDGDKLDRGPLRETEHP